MKSILVLEGGALRGIYTAGVLDILMENNIKVDAVIGVSAGALFGINYITNQPKRCINYNLEYVHKKEYMGFYSFLTTGNIMNKETCFQEIVYKTYPLDFKAFNNRKTKFYVVMTNLETGMPEYKEIKDIEKEMEYLRASGSMPLVSKNIKIENKEYLDGGMSDSIPIKWAEKEKYDKIIVVETRPKEYRKKKSTTKPYEWKYKKYPNFIKTIQERYQKYNETKEYIIDKENKKEILVIRPSKTIHIKRLEKNKKRIKEMYELGRLDSSNKLKQIQEFLKEKNS